MEEAAENLGAKGMRRLFKMTLPLDFAEPVCRDHDRFHLGAHRARRAAHVRLHAHHLGADLQRINDIGRSPLVYALVVTLLFITRCVYVLARVTFGRTTHAVASKSSASPQERRALATRRRRLRGVSRDRSSSWPRYPTSRSCCSPSRAIGTAPFFRRASRWRTSAPRSATTSSSPPSPTACVTSRLSTTFDLSCWA